MKSAAIVCSVVGAVGSFVAAVWMLVGFKPERYTDDGMLYPGQQKSMVVPRLLRDQTKVVALITISAALQLVGVVLGIVSN